MRPVRFGEELTISILRGGQGWREVADLYRWHRISDATFHAWRSKYMSDHKDPMNEARGDQKSAAADTDVAEGRPIEALPGALPVLGEEQEKRHGIALCLSGGGFRASLFHLGCLRRLRELGILDQVRTISSVSGGSIVSGF